MKKYISIAVLLVSVAFVSCRKETVTGPLVAPAPTTINVEYRVFCESGHMNVEYTMNDNGVVTQPSVQIDRTNFSQSFNWTTGQTLSIKASNSIPSAKQVIVEIYVNGTLFKSGQAGSPNEEAIASGIYQ